MYTLLPLLLTPTHPYYDLLLFAVLTLSNIALNNICSCCAIDDTSLPVPTPPPPPIDPTVEAVSLLTVIMISSTEAALATELARDRLRRLPPVAGCTGSSNKAAISSAIERRLGIANMQNTAVNPYTQAYTSSNILSKHIRKCHS